jgi:hypothetical protein
MRPTNPLAASRHAPVSRLPSQVSTSCRLTKTRSSPVWYGGHAGNDEGGLALTPGIAPGTGEATGHWTCVEWAHGIADYFFAPGMGGLPAPLSLDDDAAAAIRGLEAGAAAEDLARAVRSQLRPGTDNLFWRFCSLWSDWRLAGCSDVPPYLPLLGVAVLAASRMEASAGVSPTNYYRRLRELLRLPAVHHPIPGYDQTMPDLWQGLAHWLDSVHGGARGRSSIDFAPDAHVRYIGSALSQAELRRSDRQRLGAFFRYLRLAPGDAVDPEELLSYFRAWAPTTPLSPGARRAAQDLRSAERLRQILAADLAGWDGRERDSTGRTVAALAVTLSLRYPPTLRLAAERTAGSPEVAAVVLPGGRAVRLAALTDRWFEPIAYPPSDKELREGLRIGGDAISFTLPGSDCFVLCEDDELGCLASVRTAPAMRPCAALIHDSRRSDAMKLLQGAATGWRERSSGAALPTGWFLITGIEIGAVPDDLPPGFEALIPKPGTRISLVGGLRLPRGGDCYLTGGEPDVFVPDPEALACQVDGQPAEPDASGRIPLSRLGLAEAPQHTVTVGPATRTFRSLHSTGLLCPQPSTRLAVRLAANGSRYTAGGWAGPAHGATPPAGEVWVEGMLASGSPDTLPAPPRAPLRLRSGPAEYLVVGASPGDLLRVPVLRPPAWATRAGLVWNFDEAECPFEPVWILARWATGPHSGWQVHLAVARQPGELATGDRALLAAWRGAFTLGCYPDEADPQAVELWDAYLDAADTI